MTDSTEAIYQAALDALRRGESVALATVVDAGDSVPRDVGARMLVYGDGRTVGSVGGGPSEAWVIDQARQALAEGRPRLLQRSMERGDQDPCGETMRFFVDVLLRRPTLLIVGAGHIGQAVASVGAWLGYRVAVLDDRAALVSSERLPDADVLLSGPVDEKLREFPLTERTYVVLVTPHHSPDERALLVLAEHPVGYVGLLGSRRRARQTFKRARDLGVPDAFLEQIHAPIGLDIRAETPREIALSILADITTVRREKS
jgi:xanthine dehydrogenase accessory factor